MPINSVSHNIDGSLDIDVYDKGSKTVNVDFGNGNVYINHLKYVPESIPVGNEKALHDMLATQSGFQVKLYPDFYKYTSEERTEYIKEHSIHLNQEINEMLYELPYFKPWKDYSGMGDEAKELAFAKARKEMIDAWHFFMNIMLALGFSAEEFTKMYFEKNKINYQRQADGYTFDKSYRENNNE